MKRYCRFISILIALMVAIVVTACSTAQPTKPVEVQPEVEATPTLPVEQQEQLAMNTFNDMLEMTADRPRKEVLPELVAGYEKIIKEAPDTFLAEESHFRLMVHYFEDPASPQVEKAEEIYRQYFERYKQPKMGPAFNSTLARLYFNYEKWDRLADFMVPFVRDYVETGKIVDSLYLFYYSEAKYHLKDYGEATRGFRLLIRENPPGMELNFARKRISEIRHLVDPNITEEQ